MEEVFLSGMLGLQSHKCYECGRLLNPNYGHEYPARRKSAVEKVNGFETKQTENSITVPNKSQRRNSSANLTQDACAIRACHLTGKYYCERCHWNDQWYIPGSIFLLNDMSLQPMCRSAYLKIRVLWDAAIFRIPAYWHQENAEAAKVFEVRSRLHQMLRYTLVCAEASALKEFAELTEPAHLLGYPNYMRMADVINILNGTLHPKLQSHLERWTAHINSCEICLVNGRPTDLEANVIRSRHRNSVSIL
ncbi:unnamed protein product [Dicrocoelium dendriticum]|nr:unnamed protein product [Dicrocoelium dendriticum]